MYPKNFCYSIFYIKGSVQCLVDIPNQGISTNTKKSKKDFLSELLTEERLVIQVDEGRISKRTASFLFIRDL